VATTPRTQKPVSEETRAKDERLKKRLENLSDEDMKQFDRALGEAIKPTGKQDGSSRG
jgi:hypothetical protein